MGLSETIGYPSIHWIIIIVLLKQTIWEYTIFSSIFQSHGLLETPSDEIHMAI